MTLPYDEHCGQDADLFRSLYMLHLKRVMFFYSYLMTVVSYIPAI